MFLEVTLGCAFLFLVREFTIGLEETAGVLNDVVVGRLCVEWK